jgi:hypothetical protein
MASDHLAKLPRFPRCEEFCARPDGVQRWLGCQFAVLGYLGVFPDSRSQFTSANGSQMRLPLAGVIAADFGRVLTNASGTITGVTNRPEHRRRAGRRTDQPAQLIRAGRFS